MDRRKFIQLLTTSAVSLYTIDPDKLLWVPGEKTIFVPPVKQLVYASEVHLSDLQLVKDIIKDTFSKDKLLYEIVHDKTLYKTDTGFYQTLQIYHGFEVKKSG